MELGLGLTKIIPLMVYLTGIAVLFITLFYKIEFGIYFLIPLLTQQSLLTQQTATAALMAQRTLSGRML